MENRRYNCGNGSQGKLLYSGECVKFGCRYVGSSEIEHVALAKFTIQRRTIGVRRVARRRESLQPQRAQCGGTRSKKTSLKPEERGPATRRDARRPLAGRVSPHAGIDPAAAAPREHLALGLAQTPAKLAAVQAAVPIRPSLRIERDYSRHSTLQSLCSEIWDRSAAVALPNMAADIFCTVMEDSQ